MAAEELINFDDDRLIGIVSAKLKHSVELANTVNQLEYELGRMRKVSCDQAMLLAQLRLRLFQQNNMELVKMIDEGGRNV